jgi:SAM-dependent methyltransferase
LTDYAGFARFYDRIVGDRSEEIDRIRAYIAAYRPAAASLLELGCGTGALLAGLTPAYQVTGVDRSREMLAIAASRVPAARLIRADMTSFALAERFDVAICMFDTLNHLPSFDRWQALFDRVHEHLAPGGLFIFDVNTSGRLRRLHGGPSFLEEVDGNVVVMSVEPAGGWLSMWQTRIFERLHDDIYRLHDERILELGVPLAHLRAALAGRFEVLLAEDLDGGQVSDDCDRVFFAARRLPGPADLASPSGPG